MKKQIKTSWALIIVLAAAVIIGGTALAWAFGWVLPDLDIGFQSPVQISKNSNANVNKNANVNSTQESCNFTKEVALKKGTTYSMMGDEEFDTVVCGYMKTKEIPADETMQNEAQTNAYFVISKFKDAKFQASMDKSMSEGNTVNEKSSSKYQFNLGCYENKTITVDTGTTFDTGVKQAILNSTAAKPVAIILSFKEHEGRGCNCCNLAENISLY